jgi:dynein heavy chain
VFGLHVNSAIARDLQTTSQLFHSYLSVVESVGVADGHKTSEDLLVAIASDILTRLPDGLDVEAAAARYPVTYAESMNAVLVQEMERFNALLSIIRESLRDLIRAIRGAITMTPELETMALSLSAAKYPSFWSKFSYPSLKFLGGYISDFIERLNFMQVSHVMCTA